MMHKTFFHLVINIILFNSTIIQQKYIKKTLFSLMICYWPQVTYTQPIYPRESYKWY